MRSSTRYPLQTVQAAIDQIARRAEGAGETPLADALVAVSAEISSQVHDQTTPPPEPHPASPSVGTSTTSRYVVGAEDTAAAAGHPDQRMTVLSTPRLALWFELESVALIAQSDSTINAGVGILTHHVGLAQIGETVEVETEVVAVSGRSVSFACEARTEDRLVAFGVHQRVISDLAAKTGRSGG